MEKCVEVIGTCIRGYLRAKKVEEGIKERVRGMEVY